MRKLALFLLLSCSAWGQIAFVNSKQTAGSTTGSAGSGSFSATIGNTEVVIGAFYDGQNKTPHITSITDCNADTYTNLVVTQPSNKVFVEVWYTTLSATNASCTVTVNYSPTGTGTSVALQFVQYSGVLQVNTSNAVTGTSASATSASLSLTTSNNNNFVLGAFAVHSAVTLTVSGCTGRGQNTNNGGATANLWDCDNTAASPSSVAVGMTFPSAAWTGAAIELCSVNPCIASAGHIRHQVLSE